MWTPAPTPESSVPFDGKPTQTQNAIEQTRSHPFFFWMTTATVVGGLGTNSRKKKLENDTRSHLCTVVLIAAGGGWGTNSRENP